ncbi:variant erythrocyte surface antigen-1 family protein [Babesia caballi]|uniref:Variant erythrocyte surface antigen-1 family protein n=1 Tax=Babesia caballi TaxID=5871 RepID=A0AAV4LMF4_BABCB|nr:variant erythrocyte surface antigen-1 family protein [Babesia caballi]
MGGKETLTEWPENLKEVIDWFLRVAEMDQNGDGFGKVNELQKAVEALHGFTQATSNLGKFNVEGLFKKVAEGLQQLIGYDRNGRHDIKGEGIGQDSTVGKYASSYGNQANWNEDSSNLTTYAKIFLYSMPLLFYGITYTFWQCTRGNWKNQTIPGDFHGAHFYTFLLDMGYNSDKLKNGCKGHDVMIKVGGVIDELSTATASSYNYPKFLKQLEDNGKPNLPKRAYNHTLYALYAASHAYLTTKLPSLKIEELPQTQSEIAKTLNGYSEAVKFLDLSNAQKLSEAYLALLSQIKDVFNDDPPASSSVGATAGGVLGTAAVGGTAAALATNVGGITTTLTNLIPIFK